MEADLDRRASSQSVPVLSPLAGYLALWLVLVLLLGAMVYSGQLRQAREDFGVRVSSIHREIDAKLKANEIVLDGVAAFLRVVGVRDEQALHAYSRQVLNSFPQIHQVGLQRRVAYEDLPRLATEMKARGVTRFQVRQFDSDQPRSASDKRPYLVTVALSPSFYSEAPDLALDLDAGDFLREAVARALERGRSVASRMIHSGSGQWAYALFRPVYEPGDSRYGNVLASLLVQVEDLLPPHSVLPADIDVHLQHGHYASSDSQAWVLEARETGTALERMLLPRLRAVRVFGTDAQPFVLTVDRQLGWNIIDPLLAAAFVLTSGLGLFMAVSYGRSQARREHERRRSEQKLYKLANFDSLTELPNRNLFHDRLRQALSRARRHQTSVALFFLDLDGFKAVNDSAGHASGDRLLQLVAGRLLKAVREHDTVARLSGDEFVVLLEDIKNREDVERVRRQLHESFVESFRIGGFEFMLTTSIGLAVYPDDGDEPAQLLQRADQNMYATKYPEWAPAPTARR